MGSSGRETRRSEGEDEGEGRGMYGGGVSFVVSLI